MARRIARSEGVGWKTVLGGRAALRQSAAALWVALGIESLGQQRYRKDCERPRSQWSGIGGAGCSTR